MSNTQAILCLKQLEGLLCEMPGDSCVNLLERILTNCGCVRGRKAFPCLQDQTVINFLLKMSLRRDDIRKYLSPYLEDVLSVISEFLDQAQSGDYDFLSFFFCSMVTINCSVTEIFDILQFLREEKSNSLFGLLYCGIIKYLADYAREGLDEHLSSLFQFFKSISKEEFIFTNFQLVCEYFSLATSLLLNSKIWKNPQQTGRQSEADINFDRHYLVDKIIQWCNHLLCSPSDGSEFLSEAELKTYRSAIMSLVACTRVNKSNDYLPFQAKILFYLFYLAQIALSILNRLVECSDRAVVDIDELVRALPSITMSTKALAFQISLSLLDSYHPVAKRIRHDREIQMKLEESHPSRWSPLAAIVSDYVLNVFQTGVIFLDGLQLVDSFFANDESEIWKPLLNEFAEKLTGKLDPTCAVLRQLAFSSELATQVSSQGKWNTFTARIIELVIIFVIIGRQEYCEIGWEMCTMKLFLQQILDLCLIDIFPNQNRRLTQNSNENEGSISGRTEKLLGLLDALFDSVCIVTPLSSSAKDADDDFSLVFGRSLYPSLVDMLSNTATASGIVVESICKILAKISARHDSEFLTQTLDIFCCSYSRSFSIVQMLEESPIEISDSTQQEAISLHFLSALASGLTQLATVSIYLGGGLDCVPPRIETPSHLRYPILLGIHKAFVKLFIELANIRLIRSIEDVILSNHTSLRDKNISSAFGLLYLLPAISTTMMLLAPSKENLGSTIVEQEDANSIVDLGHLISYDILSLQALWIHLSIFQFTNQQFWEIKLTRARQDRSVSFESFLAALEQIALFTPPLVEFRGGESIAYLETEAQSNPVAKAILNTTTGGKINGKYDWIQDCTEFNFKLFLKGKSISKLFANIGLVLVLSAIHYLEKIRITTSGDARMIFYYLTDEGVASSQVASKVILRMAKFSLLDQWKSSRNVLRIKISPRLSQRILDGPAFIKFLLTRCIHSSRSVRDLAFSYTEKLFQLQPSLYWTYDSIFTLLRCLDVMGLLLSSAGIQINPPSYISTDPWNNDVFLNILPSMEFPGSVEEISDASRKLFEFGYKFLTQATLEISELIFSILEEYILISASSQNFPTPLDIQIGVSMANEICASGRPTFHLNPTIDSYILRRERSDAAASVSHYFHLLSKEKKVKYAYNSTQPTNMSLKSRFIGEASGILNSVIFLNEEIDIDQKSNRLSIISCYHDSFVSLFSMFEQLLLPLPEHSPTSFSQCENLILRGAALLRSMALTHNHYTQWHSNRFRTAVTDIFSHELIAGYTLTLLNYFTTTLKRFFSQQLISCLLFVWKWLLGSSPDVLGSLVIHNAIFSFQQTATMNVGMFHRHNDACLERKSFSRAPNTSDDIRPSNAPLLLPQQSPIENKFLGSNISGCQSDPKGHEDWIDFLGQILTAYGPQYSSPIFSTIEATLQEPNLFSTDSSTLVARFKLLVLSLKLLKASLLSTSSTFIISIHRRRILRERILELSLLWFQGFNQFAPLQISVIDREILTLQDFLFHVTDDYHLWAVEYSENVSELSTGQEKKKNFVPMLRSPGPYPALKFLRNFLSPKRFIVTEGRTFPTLRNFGITIHEDKSASSTERKTAKDFIGVIWLVRAFLLHHIDFLIAWRGKRYTAVSTLKKTKSILSSANIDSLLKDFNFLLNSSDDFFTQGILIAWSISPSIAISFAEKFKHRILSSKVRQNATLTCLLSMITTNPESARGDWRVLHYVGSLENPETIELFLKELCHWSLASVPCVLNLMNRWSLSPFLAPSQRKRRSLLSTHPVVVQYVVRCLRMHKFHHINTVQFYLPQLVQSLRQDIYGLIGDFIGELAVSSTLLCHQLIWLLQLESVDENNISGYGYCRKLTGKDPLPRLASDSLARTRHLLTPSQREYLDSECEYFNSVTNISAKLKSVKDKDKHPEIIKDCLLQLGFPRNLYLPTDPYKAVTEVVVDSGVPMQSAAKCPYLLIFHTAPWGGPDSMSTEASNSADMGPSTHRNRLDTVSIRKNELRFSIPQAPTTPKKIGIGKLDGRSFSSPKIIDPLISEKEQELYQSTSSGEGRGSGSAYYQSTSSSNADLIDHSTTDSNPDLIDTSRSSSCDPGTELNILQRSPYTKLSENHFDESKSDIEIYDEKNDESHPSLSKTLQWNSELLNQPQLDQGKIPPKTWGQWKDFRLSRPHKRRLVPFRATVLVGKHTPYPVHSTTASDGKEACIFKVYDDCRQDALTIQVVRMLKDAFEIVNLPVYLVPYSVIPNRTGPDRAQGGILQVVANVKSRDQLGKDGTKTLKQYFLNQFGSETSPTFKQAQLEFARSLAGYAIVCYILSIKDRHNGNILIDTEGHIIHIDFGFLLGISPGGNLGFENAAFKLTKEMIHILGGSKDAEPFRCFVDLTIQGFLVAREIMTDILILVTSMMDSGLPCFLHKDNNLDSLRERFFPHCADGEAAEKMRSLIDDAANKWTTVAYDGIQKLQNNIYSDSWK